MVNGVGGATGDQDTENTELMAIYTKDNQAAEKVTENENMEVKYNLISNFVCQRGKRTPVITRLIKSLLTVTCHMMTPW